MKRFLTNMFGLTAGKVKDNAGGKRHVNPDGSLGGFVSNGASVDPKAYMAPSSYAFSGAVLGPEDRLEPGDLATEHGITRAPGV